MKYSLYAYVFNGWYPAGDDTLEVVEVWGKHVFEGYIKSPIFCLLHGHPDMKKFFHKMLLHYGFLFKHEAKQPWTEPFEIMNQNI
jgi:hypothetical protein